MGPLETIPVIDVRQGLVVHARRGERDRYQPVRSILCQGSEPLAVVEGLLRLYPFSTIYAADLDAIEGTGDNLAVLRELHAAFPRLRLWLDAGFHDTARSLAWLGENIGTLVLGSEAQRGTDTLARLRDGPHGDGIILSLDFRDERFIGPEELLQPACWPDRMIAMTLGRVGSDEGPDLERLRGIQAQAGRRRVYAAGGVRGLADLDGLVTLGVAGVLVASALHDGRLGRRELEQIAPPEMRRG
jgi:phosphoribosylformimino-5-aminoimidazole carboxamide ribotide isomerase